MNKAPLTLGNMIGLRGLLRLNAILRTGLIASSYCAVISNAFSARGALSYVSLSIVPRTDEGFVAL